MTMKTITVVQRMVDFEDQFAGWLREAGFRVRTCSGPRGPAFDCLSQRFYDCPLWTQADLLIYDPWLQTGPSTYDSSPLLAQEHMHTPTKPILIWCSGGTVPADIAAMEGRGEACILPVDLSREELIAEVERLIGPAEETRAAAAKCVT
jgi:hypothetical protein